ncbi:MAG: sugar ABC transporter permease [Clostridia bacterium]|nr:sugar ABC transporter permease [Clostridia bacterium]
MTQETVKVNKTKALKPVKKRKSASLDKKKARGGWLFVLPFVIGFVLLYIPMIYDSLLFSFNQIEIVPRQGYTLKPLGWGAYSAALFENTQFVPTLLKGLQGLAFDIPMILIFSLFMAVLLNQKMVGRAAFRAILFVPVILSTGILGGAQFTMTQTDAMGGAIDDGSGTSASEEIVSAIDLQKFFEGMVVGQELVEYVTVAINNIFSIVNRSGVQILIFLAGLQSISPAIYESVQIDGATAWETFWKITFPMITPMILVNAVYTIIDAFTMETNVVMSYINNTKSSIIDASGLAMSWMYFLLVIVIIAAVAGIFSTFVFYQKRN